MTYFIMCGPYTPFSKAGAARAWNLQQNEVLELGLLMRRQ